MAESDIKKLILKNLPFNPTVEQLALIGGLDSFLTNHAPNEIFLLNGYAGTGKTSIIGATVKALASLKKKTVVLAPTGRAAKVAANLAFGKAFTIHKKLFRGNSADPANSTFFLAENKEQDTLFIVDEASLITDGDYISNSLLLQLIKFVYSAPGCYLIFLGDLAQLPPVGQSQSQAMNPERLRQIGLNPIQYSLVNPVRQASESGILYNATNIRNFLFSKGNIENFTLYYDGFPDVEMISSSDLFDEICSSWSKVGKDETLVITRSNFRANNINNAIRRYLLDADTPLIYGERLIISKNDYFWSKENKLDNFIANGDQAEVTGIGKKVKKYGRWFADVDLKIHGFETTVGAKIIFRSLVSPGPSIPKDEMERFYNLVLSETEGSLSEKIKASMLSPYYNALQVKYGYCVTCHKAQGGQWKHVYIDLGGIPSDFPQNEFYRWLYTAVTRATEKVFFVNSPFNIA